MVRARMEALGGQLLPRNAGMEGRQDRLWDETIGSSEERLTRIVLGVRRETEDWLEDYEAGQKLVQEPRGDDQHKPPRVPLRPGKPTAARRMLAQAAAQYIREVEELAEDAPPPRPAAAVEVRPERWAGVGHGVWRGR